MMCVYFLLCRHRSGSVHFGFFVQLVWISHCVWIVCTWHIWLMSCAEWKASLTIIPTWNMFVSMSIWRFMRFSCDNWSMFGRMGLATKLKKRYQTSVWMKQREIVVREKSLTYWIFVHSIYIILFMKYIHARKYISISLRLMSTFNLLGNWPKLLTLTKNI